MGTQRKQLRVLFSSSEIAPFATTGGLADTVVEIDVYKEKVMQTLAAIHEDLTLPIMVLLF
jgi:glycogen synthase